MKAMKAKDQLTALALIGRGVHRAVHMPNMH
jgi:hypothetical protein